ncbi:MAG TPA: sensor histidine kinase [Candidatus Eisenbergiella merdipullorum]|uniref:histidine kinase n=1 Tax=Candidatus Eisenbergiella merdipullorum TaxID=2838553 RepID=A0A9D2L298_9FIRM|nr:sensor histidine kinase [Candidatus Eisenbergiella merdipullorum]
MIRIIRKIARTFFYQMNLMQKLLISYFLLILVPMLLLTFLTYAHVSKTLIRQFQYSSDQALQQTSIYLDKVMEEIESATDQIAFNRVLSDIFQTDTSDDSVVEIYENYLTASSLLQNVFTSDALYSVEIYIEGDSLYVSEESRGEQGVSFISPDCSYARELDEKLSGHSGKILYLAPRILQTGISADGIPVITGARYIKASPNYSNLGILTVNIRQETLNSIIGRACVLPNSISLLLDQNGTVMAVSDEAMLETYPDLREIIQDRLSGDSNSFTAEKETILINATTLDSSQWALISVIPYEEMLKTSLATRNRMLLIFFVISSLFYIVAYLISRSITARIRFLAKRMKEIQFDNYAPISNIVGNDEISDLTNSYNYMLNKINAYADSQYHLGITLKNSELKALQAQINPHFLYNTLDLLHWLAEDYGADEISEIVSLLSRFYKLSLSRGVDVVSLKDAIQHIEIYVKLQNFRFGDSIHLEVELSPDICGLSILKLLLQPIVENSILHGILEKEQQTGTISIKGYVAEGDLKIQISDDGVGMTSEQIHNIMDVSPSNPAGGYGIKNIIERIRLYYGSRYGLSYESQPGQGTSVTVTIPCIKHTDQQAIISQDDAV